MWGVVETDMTDGRSDERTEGQVMQDGEVGQEAKSGR